MCLRWILLFQSRFVWLPRNTLCDPDLAHCSNRLSLYWRLISSIGPMIECPRGAKVNGKALEWRTTLAVSVWLPPLHLGFSASDPIAGAESLACKCSPMPSLGEVHHTVPGFFRYALIEWVESLTWSFCPVLLYLGLCSGGDLHGLYSTLFSCI